MKKLSALFATAALTVACAPEAPEAPESESSDVMEERVKADTVFRVTRPDYRKCMWPMCGGYFIEAVNTDQTLCGDGTYQDECYVADIELDYVSDDYLAPMELLISGVLEPREEFGYEMTVLKGYKAFEPQTGAEPSGAFYLVHPSGIQCIWGPCPTLRGSELNTDASELFTNLDFSQTSLSNEEINDAWKDVYEKGLIVSGAAGFGALSSQLVVTELYSTVEPEEPGPALCMSDNQCEPNEYCDHTECHSNCKPGMMCPAVCWGECKVAPESECPSGGEICADLCGPGPSELDIPGHCPIPMCQCPAPANDSCDGNCGGASPDKSCYCDDLCESYGDCCGDYEAVCI